MRSINVNIGENIKKETSLTYIQRKREQFGDSMRNYIIALYRKDQSGHPIGLKITESKTCIKFGTCTKRSLPCKNSTEVG